MKMWWLQQKNGKIEQLEAIEKRASALSLFVTMAVVSMLVSQAGMLLESVAPVGMPRGMKEVCRMKLVYMQKEVPPEAVKQEKAKWPRDPPSETVSMPQQTTERAPVKRPLKHSSRPVNRKLSPITRQKPVPVKKAKVPEPTAQPSEAHAEAVKPLDALREEEVKREQMPLAPDRVFDVEEVDDIPAVLYRKRPRYPRRARRLGITGRVEVRFLVNSKGAVEKIEIVKAKPHGIFEKSVENALKRWRFRPGVRSGHKVSTWMKTTINFELE